MIIWLITINGDNCSGESKPKPKPKHTGTLIHKISVTASGNPCY